MTPGQVTDGLGGSVAKGAAAGMSTGNPYIGIAAGLADYAANFGSSIGAAAYTGGLSKKAQMRAFQHQYDMYMLDYSLHTPSNQMKLLKEAKLNPNLVYGGSNPANVSASTPSAPINSAPHVDPPKSQMLTQYLDWKLRSAQIANVEAQTRSTDTETAYKSQSLIDRLNILAGRLQALNDTHDRRSFDLGFAKERGFYPPSGPSGRLHQAAYGLEHLSPSIQNLFHDAVYGYEYIRSLLDEKNSPSKHDQDLLMDRILREDMKQYQYEVERR